MFYPYLVTLQLLQQLQDSGWLICRKEGATYAEITTQLDGFEFATQGFGVGELDSFWTGYFRLKPECPIWGATRQYLEKIRPLTRERDMVVGAEGDVVYINWSFYAPSTSADEVVQQVNVNAARYGPLSLEIAQSILCLSLGDERVDTSRHVALLVEQLKLSTNRSTSYWHA